MENYKILSIVNKTQYSLIYRALKLDTNSLVAIEKLDLAAVAEVKKRMEEQHVLSLVKDSVVSLGRAEVFRDKTHVYFQSELVEHSLEYVSTKKISLETVKLIMFELLYSLQQLHNAGLVHKRLSPQNCVLQNSLFKVNNLHCCINPGELQPEYSSPEVLMDMKVSSSADVFSMGVILLELITGANLFKGDTNSIVLAKMVFNLGIPFKWKGFAKLEKHIEITQKYYNKLELLLREYPSGILIMAKEMLHWDAEKRSSAGTLLQNSFFDDVRRTEFTKIKRLNNKTKFKSLTPRRTKFLTVKQSKYSPADKGSIFYTDRIKQNRFRSAKGLPSLFNPKVNLAKKLKTAVDSELQGNIELVKAKIRKIYSDRDIDGFIGARLKMNKCRSEKVLPDL